MKSLVLASASPRRQQLLAVLGLEFSTISADVDERQHENELADELTIRLAETKARHVYQIVGKGCRVLGGDTVVALDGMVMGKPRNRAEAMEMLGKLSGQTHSVFSAVSLVEDNCCHSLLSETRVTFALLTDRQIQEYCKTSDPYDKAGGYGIQGEAGNFVTRLEGSYSGVVGLPLWETHQLLMGTA